MLYTPVRYYENFFLEFCEEFTCLNCRKTKIRIWEKLDNGLKFPLHDEYEEEWWWIKEDERPVYILCSDCYFKIFNPEKKQQN